MSTLGQTAWNKGKKFPHSPEWEAKRIAASRAAIALLPKRSGYHRPQEHMRPMLEALQKSKLENPEKYRQISIRNLPKNVAGERNGNWKGGRTKTDDVNWRIRNWGKVVKWRREILERFGRKCVECGADRDLHVHHIVALAECQGAALLPMNGVPLCKTCHHKTDSYGGHSRTVVGLGNHIAIIKAIPHHWQQYPTCGNWDFGEDGTCVVFVSQMGNFGFEFLVALHEITEAMLCKRKGIMPADVTAFDIQFEKDRAAGLPGNEDEPGDDKRAPYYKQHQFATKIEKLAARALGVKWKQYEAAIYALP